jgi:transcriptional regulator with XRE-family HTH domain
MVANPLSVVVRNFFCRLDVTQKEIADRSGYCTAYFSRIMNGISAPNSLEVLELLICI